MSIAKTVLNKYTGEIRTYVFDFTNFPEVLSGDSLTSPVVTGTPSGLTIGTPAVNTGTIQPGATSATVAQGKAVLVQISGGTAATSYTLKCTVQTSGGSTLEVDGTLNVE